MEIIRETVYEHIDGNDTFTITACERWSINMCKRLKEKYPDEVEIVHENEDGTLLVHMPYKWMKVKPPKKMNLSEEERAIRAERLKGFRNK